MKIQCACGRSIGVNLGHDEHREERSGLAALAGTCPFKPDRRCDAEQRYQELKAQPQHDEAA